MGNNCRKFVTVLLAGLGTFVAAGFVSTPEPVFPIAADQEIGLSKTAIGFITCVYDIGMITSFLIVPQISAKFNLKTCVIVALLVSSTSISLFGVSILMPTKTLFILSSSTVRLIMAFSNSVIFATSNPIGTALFPDHSGKVIGFTSTLICFGRVLPPVQSSFLYGLEGFIAPFVAAGLVGVVLMVFVTIFMLPHQKATTNDDVKIDEENFVPVNNFQTKKHEREDNPLSILTLATKPKVILISFPYFLNITVNGLIAVYLTPFLVEKCNIEENHVGFYFMVIALGGAIVAPIIGYISDKGGTKIIFVASSFTGVLSCLVIMYMLHYEENHIVAVFVILVLFGFTGTGSYLSCWLTLREIMALEEPGRDQTQVDVLISVWVASCYNSGKILGSFVIFGFVFDFFGYFAAILVEAVCLSVAFIFSAFVIFLSKKGKTKRVKIASVSSSKEIGA